jgi:hypothetical protein
VSLPRFGSLVNVALWWALCTWACRDHSSGSEPHSGAEDRAAPSAATHSLVAERPRTLSSSPARAESRGAAELERQRDPLDQLLPPEYPSQRLAFDDRRLAWLDAEQVQLLRLGDFASLARVAVPDGRNVVALVGGGFLALGRDHVYRVSRTDRRAQLFPRAPRIGPTTLIPSLHESEQFWLHYGGLDDLPQFDLAQQGLTGFLPVIGWTPLRGFDGRVVLGLGDGSVLYTVADGLRRIDVEGRPEHLPIVQVAGQIWALARAPRLDQVWAATRYHAYLLTAREQADTVERLELPPHPLALATRGPQLAVLSVESLEPEALGLRVDVFTRGSAERHVLRFSAGPGPAADRGTAPAFVPEIALSPRGDWLAVAAYGLHVYDWRRGMRVFPQASTAQNLAPGSL